MDKNYLTQLTQDVYRLTLLFPKKEPLRYQMREMANEVLANSLRNIYPVSPAPKLGAGSNGANQYEYTNRNSKEMENGSPKIFEELKVLDSYFEVAKSQNWVKPVEILRLQEQYDRIRAELKKNQKSQEKKSQEEEAEIPVEKKLEPVQTVPAAQAVPETPTTPARESLAQETLSERQAKILGFLKQNGRAQVGQLKKYFPDVTKRTLRRDFRRLLRKGAIERLGEKNETYYKIKT